MSKVLTELLDDQTVRQWGQVLKWDTRREFGIIATGDGSTFLAAARDIKPDNVGRSYLVPNENVSFLIGNGRRPTAIDVTSLGRKLFERIPADYHETVTLTSWNGQRGFAQRPLAGTLYVHVDHIVTEGVEHLRKGAKLWTQIAPPPTTGKLWQAVNAEILTQDQWEIAEPTRSDSDATLFEIFNRVGVSQPQSFTHD